MQLIKSRWAHCVAALCLGWGLPASACTTATSNIGFGRHSSYIVGTTTQQGSGSAGLSCNVLLALLSAHYVGLRVDASTFTLSGPGGSQISYIASLSANGTALTVGNFINLSSISILSLFAGTNDSIPIYLRTVPKTALRAGVYTGFIDLRWYYSVCNVGVGLCADYASSPGFVRPIPLVSSLDWGSGVAVRVNIELDVANDCFITAPDLDFGSAPLLGSFNPVTRTILIRCSAGSTYTVGLDDGGFASGGVRQMASGTDRLAYEIYKSINSPERWGRLDTARRSSLTADSNAGVHDSVTEQGYTYRAEILANQPAPVAGSYSDTIRVDVEF
jgi:spore coat protein U-like protein